MLQILQYTAMDQRALQQFLTLAETLHFGRAAAASNVSPSTLSRSVLKLEQTVGAPLFTRDNREVALTREGQIFRRYAEDAARLWADLEQDLLETTGELRGRLTVYSSVTASYSFLHSLLAALRQAHPNIDISLQTGDPEHAVPSVQSGDVQISIGAHPGRLAKSLSFKAVAETPLVFIAATNSRFGAALNDDATSNNWQQAPMILPERGVARENALAWFRRRKISPQIVSEVAGNEAIVSMVSLGEAIGLVPRIVLDNSPLADRVMTIEVNRAPAPLQVGLFVQSRNLGNRLVKALWDIAG